MYLYGPALNGPFLFDDHALPYASAAAAERPLAEWISVVRPVLMFSYWVNGRLLGPEPSSYRTVNVLLHVANAVLVLLFVRRVLRVRKVAAQHAFTAAAAAAMLFLVHPVQTESVAYIAGRSETLTAFFVLSALLVFVYQPRDMSSPAAAGIIALYGCAVLSKEQAVVLPVLLLLTDVLLFGRSVRDTLRERRKLCVGLVIAAAGGLVVVGAVLRDATTAGFRLEGLSSFEYFLTQSRVAFLYMQLILLPLWQNADYDLPVSRGLLEHGSLLALLAVAAALAAAWQLRQRCPVAVYGIAFCIVCLAPTSSFVPIRDVAAERRLYLPLLGALFVMVEVLLRQRPRAIAAVAFAALIAGALTYRRAALWGNDVAFWSDTASQSVTKTRAYTHLMHALLRSGRCESALRAAAEFPARTADDSDFLVSLGYAYDCAKRPEDAVHAYRRAAARSRGPGTYLILANAYERLGQTADADRVRAHALRLEARTSFDRAALERYLRRTEQTRARLAQTP